MMYFVILLVVWMIPIAHLINEMSDESYETEIDWSYIFKECYLFFIPIVGFVMYLYLWIIYFYAKWKK